MYAMYSDYPIQFIVLCTLSLWMYNPGLTILMAYLFEGASPKRFMGKGSSRGFWIGNLLSSTMIAVGFYGFLYDGRRLPVDNQLWAVLSLVIGVAAFLLTHIIDHANYADNPNATDSSPSKWCNDILCGFYAMFHVAYTVPVIFLLPHDMTGSLIRGWIAFCLLVLGIGITHPSKIDYAKIHPANWRQLSGYARPNLLRNFINEHIYHMTRVDGCPPEKK